MAQPHPFADLTFDEVATGDRFPLGTHVMTREDVIAFAAKYDPQPYHLDDAAAAANPVFGRLSASGWHTVMVINRLLDIFWKSTRVRGLAGAGVDEIRWLRPAFPGDTLTGEIEILNARPSSSRPERGVMTMRGTVRNQNGGDVATLTMTGIFERHAPGLTDQGA